MTTTRDHTAVRAAPRPAVAWSFLGDLATQDFARLRAALAADARLRGLLPGGPREWTGAEKIAEVFGRWFGGTEDFELVEAAAGEVGGRLHLHWRLRLRAERLGTGWFTVEQHAYADADEDGDIAQLDVLCTGYLPERGDD
jgi:hypothetical protein